MRQQEIEIKLHRLLRACENNVDSEILVQYQKEASRLLATLHDIHPSSSYISEFERKVASLSTSVNQLKLEAMPDRSAFLSRIELNPDIPSEQKQAEKNSFLSAQHRLTSKLRQGLLSSAAPSSSNDQAPASSSESHPSSSSASASSESLFSSSIRRRKTSDPTSRSANNAPSLAQQQEMQDSLTSELSYMTGMLKHKSEVINKTLHEDRRILEETEQLALGNLERIRAENARLKVQNTSSWKRTLAIWMILLLVCLFFVLTYLLIRFVPSQQLKN